MFIATKVSKKLVSVKLVGGGMTRDNVLQVSDVARRNGMWFSKGLWSWGIQTSNEKHEEIYIDTLKRLAELGYKISVKDIPIQWATKIRDTVGEAVLAVDGEDDVVE